VCHRRETFKYHLQKEHKIGDASRLDEKIENSRIGRNCETRFWCGFCQKIIEITQKGLSAWTERFNHIDDHFSGRNYPKKEIKEWKNVDPDVPDADLIPGSEDSALNSPEQSHGLENPRADRTTASEPTKARSRKRKSDSDIEQRAAKKVQRGDDVIWKCV
jgi:sal-like protein